MVRGPAGELARIVVRCVRRGKTAEQNEEHEGTADEYGDFAQDRLAGTKLGPLSVGLANVTLELFETELVVDHATKSNSVAKELQRSDLGTPDHHGSNNKQNVFEHTAQGEDNGGRLADLLHSH